MSRDANKEMGGSNAQNCAKTAGRGKAKKSVVTFVIMASSRALRNNVIKP